MKYKLIEWAGGPKSVEEFCKEHRLVLAVKERPLEDAIRLKARYYANFEHVVIKDGPVLIGEFGNGASPEIAIKDYLLRIRGKHLVKESNAYDRYEFDAPNEFKELNIL